MSEHGMMLLPPSPDVCQICATSHDADMPHNAESLYYGMRFKMAHGRDGTWADAAAHCTIEMRERWRLQLIDCGGTWTEPPAGEEPIAEPMDSHSKGGDATGG